MPPNKVNKKTVLDKSQMHVPVLYNAYNGPADNQQGIMKEANIIITQVMKWSNSSDVKQVAKLHLQKVVIVHNNNSLQITQI